MPGDFGLAASTTSPLKKTMVSNQKNSFSTKLKQIMEIKNSYQIKLCKNSANTESKKERKKTIQI